LSTRKTKTTPAKKGAKAPKKEKFNTSDFVFNYPIEEIQKAIVRLEQQDADPMAEPLTEGELYWWGIWELQMPDALRRGLTHIPTCAIENAVLKLPKLGGKKK